MPLDPTSNSNVGDHNDHMDELWAVYTKLLHMQREVSRAQSGESDILSDPSADEPVAFPQTYIVIKFAPHVLAPALVWLVEKIRGNRRHGGAELLVRRQPREAGEGLVIHVSASMIKFLEVAEELELRKLDKSGLVREFTVKQMEDFLLEGMHVDDLLTTAERQFIVRHELQNVRALVEDDHVPGYPSFSLYEGQSLVQVCLQWELLEKMYPLHDLEALDKLGKKWYWAVFRKQPFEEIRLYFGEAVALYFNFIGFYTTALLVPMILGFLQFFLFTESLAFFCVFNVLWVTIFLEVWKRKCSSLAFAWGTIGMTSLDDPRPNFYGPMALDAVTGRYQPQFPRWKTNCRMYCVSLPIVGLCMIGAFFVMLGSFWAEEYLMSELKNRDQDVADIVVMLPSILYAGLVFVLNLYYRQLATWLTEWENHRTQSQFDRHRVTKLVLFEFMNNFVSLFYIAFYIQDMEMLKTQLTVMLIILQTINHFQEALLPLVIRHYGSQMWQAVKYYNVLGMGYEKVKDVTEKQRDIKAMELEEDVLRDIPELDEDDPRIELAEAEGEMDSYESTYDDYLELFIQFGYVFLFSSVYPMAAFWAVVNNIVEIRCDAFKLCRVHQRPVAKRVKDTGAWQRAFEAVGAMSVMTNCGLLYMSPHLREMAPHLTAVEWVLLFVFLEHVLLTVRHVIHDVIPDRPEWVRVALARINYQSKQALKNERMTKSRRIMTRRTNTVHGPHKVHTS